MKICADGCVVVCSWIVADALDGGRQHADWIHDGIVVVFVWNRDHLFVVLLVFECPCDSFCVCEIGVIVI